MNNLPKVVTQQRRGRASNPRLLDRKSDALPLSHRATQHNIGSSSQPYLKFYYRYIYFSVSSIEIRIVDDHY